MSQLVIWFDRYKDEVCTHGAEVYRVARPRCYGAVPRRQWRVGNRWSSVARMRGLVRIKNLVLVGVCFDCWLCRKARTWRYEVTARVVGGPLESGTIRSSRWPAVPASRYSMQSFVTRCVANVDIVNDD